jgi:hypothetical protein
MKHILGASAAVATLAIATGAFATPVASSVTVTGHVDAACSVTNGVGTLDLGSLAGSNGQYNGTIPASFAMTTGTVWCNGVSSSAKLAATPLADTTTGATGTPPPGFANKIDYSVTATVGGHSVSADTTIASGNGNSVVVGAFTQPTIPVVDTVVPSSLLLEAGAYSATVTLTLTPGT